MMVSGDWLTHPATQAVCAMLTQAGHQALFVGGCVRNALLGAPVNDIDISTDAVPTRVMELAQAAGLHAIPTGIDHGTITVVADHIPHEITTFRKDVETDGRRAVVAFSARVEDDAHRRDFTMNALYARPDGTIVDPLGGMADLNARRVRFIDDADLRIREDYLRILRYFRFHAWYGDPVAGMDPDALAAIAADLDGIATLSRERIGAEMLRLLAAPDPAPAMAAMRTTGALGAVIAGADDRALAPLVHLEAEQGLAPRPGSPPRRPGRRRGGRNAAPVETAHAPAGYAARRDRCSVRSGRTGLSPQRRHRAFGPAAARRLVGTAITAQGRGTDRAGRVCPVSGQTRRPDAGPRRPRAWRRAQVVGDTLDQEQLRAVPRRPDRLFVAMKARKGLEELLAFAAHLDPS